MDVPDLLRSGRLRALLREPLVHFLILGTGLFLLQARVSRDPGARTIVVPASALQGMRQDHLRRTGHPPSAEQEAAMLQRYLDDEARYREALSLGLDRGDVIVRRRLVQKMDFLLEDGAPLPEPTDQDLAAYLTAHAERYAAPDRVTLEHVFVSRERHPDAPADAARLRDALAAGADPASLGDPFLRGREFRLASERDLAGVFGTGFARRVMAVPAGEWAGPIESGYGSHVVRVGERRPGGAPPLEAVRETVLRDWRAERREEASRAALDRLRASYEVRVDPGTPTGGTP